MRAHPHHWCDPRALPLNAATEWARLVRGQDDGDTYVNVITLVVPLLDLRCVHESRDDGFRHVRSPPQPPPLHARPPP